MRGVHRLGDAFEREHLGDEQVHGIGLDAGAVLQRAWHLGGEARPGLGAAARAVLDVGVGVTHHLLEHDVDEGAPLVACAGGVGEVFGAARARFDAQLGDVGPGARVCSARLVRCGPLALGARTGAGGGVVGALRGGEAGVGAALWRVLFHEHRHQQLEQHQQGVEQGAALGAHLARGAQRLEPCLECVELGAQRRLVHRGHRRLPLGLDRHHRPPAPRGAQRAAAPRSAGPSSRPCA